MRQDGTPVDPHTYDYRRAARDAIHFGKLVDRFVQNLRRVAGHNVQYFATVEPQRHLAEHRPLLCTVTVESITVEVDNSRLLVDQKPKSEAGLRTVAYPAQISPALAGHLATFVADGKDAYIFTSPTGAILRRANFRRVWLKAVADAGVAEIRFHDLRHTGATIAAQTGATLKELMNRIGHSTARAAINYQHASNDRDQEIAAALDKLIKKEQGKRKAAERRASRKPPED